MSTESLPPSATEHDLVVETGTGPGQPYFVGRRTELESLYESVSRAVMTDSLQLTWLSGPAGIGKSSLSTELISILSQSGRPLAYHYIPLNSETGVPILAHYVRKRFQLSGKPDQSAKDAVEQIALGLDGIVQTDRLDDATRLLASLVGLGADADGAPVPGFDPDTIRKFEFQTRAANTALNLLRYDASKSPMLLVLDDWDRATRPDDLEMAGKIVQSLQDRPACVLILSRKKMPKGSSLADVESDNRSDLTLSSLPDDDMVRLVKSLVSRVEGLPEHLVATTVRQASGAPLLAQELVQLLCHRGVLQPKDPNKREDKWGFHPSEYESGSLPGDVKESVKERFAGLSPYRQVVLQLAAIQGEQFWIGAVVSLLRTHPDVGNDGVFLNQDPVRMKAEGTIMTLVEEGFLEGVPESILGRHPALTFAVPAMRQHALNTIPKALRKRLHRIAAQWLQRTQPTNRLLWLRSLVDQYEAGGMGPDAAQKTVEAANLALAQNRPNLAVELLQRGRALVDEESAAVAAEVLKRLGRISLEQGNYNQAEQCLMEEVHYAIILDDRNRIAQAHTLLGQVLRFMGEYGRSREHLEYAGALYTAEGDKAGQSDVFEELGRVVWEQGGKGSYAQALEHLEKATIIRRRLPHKRALARTINNLANIQLTMGHLLKAQELHKEALDIRAAVNDERGQMLSLLGLGAVQYECSDWKESLQSFEKALEIAIQLGDRTYEAILTLNIGETHLSSGRMDDAETLFEDGIALARELGNRRVEGLGLTTQAALDLAKGRQSDALTHAEEAKTIGYSLDNRHILGLSMVMEARALSNTIFVADADGSADKTRAKALEQFQTGIQYLEEMGDRIELCRALDAYGTFLLEQGHREEGVKAMQRAEDLRNKNRSDDAKPSETLHNQSTIRR